MVDKTTPLATTRQMAQDLHKHVSTNLANLQTTTEADLKKVRDDAQKLAVMLKTNVIAKGEAIKAGINAASDRLNAAEKQVKDNVATGQERLKQANLALLEGAHIATQSLSHAVAALRGNTAAAQTKPMKVAS
jgi:hypothetical protein